MVARRLLAQINYTAADVAAKMPSHTYTTGSGIFRFGWRARQNSTTIVRLRTVYMFLPQPIASCLRSPPEDTKSPFLAPVTFPAAAVPAALYSCWWKFAFVEWYMARLRFGPRLMPTLAAWLMQTARGGDPRTPRGLRAHLLLGTWSPTQPFGLVCPCFASGRLRHVGCCHDVQAHSRAPALLPVSAGKNTLPCTVPMWCLATTGLGACNVPRMLGGSY